MEMVMRQLRRYVVCCVAGALLFTLAPFAWGDTVILKDGKVLQGTFKGGDATNIQFEVDGKVQSIAVATITNLTFSPREQQAAGQPAAPSAPVAAAAPASAGAQAIAGSKFMVKLDKDVSTASNPTDAPAASLWGCGSGCWLMNADRSIGERSRQLAGELLRAVGIAVGLGVMSVTQAATFRIAAGDEPSPVSTTTKTPSKFFSAEDGWLDLSDFMDQSYGFAPVVIPITEPAVGYGAAGALVFVDRPKGDAQAGFGRPNITAVGGLATENGTWGVMAGDSRHWLDERLKTLVGVVYASVNLDFYGIGEDGALEDRPLAYNLAPVGGLVEAKYRLGNSRVWAGLGYALATTQVEFDAPATTPGLPDFERDSRVGGLTPSLTYDSRENIFTPTRGTYVEARAGLFDQALGSDDEFQRVNLTGMQFLPLHSKLTLGVRGGATLSFGDVPFYLRPFVVLRGAPVMRYQGEHVAEVEAELRWQLWKRFSLDGFVGDGVTWNDFEHLDNTLTVVTGGAGFRYELARKYGLHTGVDVAFGPDATALYVVFGNAWMRP